MFQQLLAKLAIELDKNDMPYMVIGGQAVLIYGEPRLTRDIDITLGLDAGGIEKVKAVIKALNLKILAENIGAFVEQTMVLPALEQKSGIRIDFIFTFTPYERQAISRAKKIRIGKQRVNFASLEDLIIHKMIANRERDIEDVKTIILKNTKFDKSYIIKWLKDFDKAIGSTSLNTFQKTMKLTDDGKS